MIRIDAEGINSISFTPGANALITPGDVKEHEALFEQYGFLLITAEIPLPTVFAAVRMAKSKGMTVVMDVAPVPKEPIPGYSSAAGFYQAKRDRAGQLAEMKVTDDASARECMEILRRLGYRHPLITLGKDGCLAWTGKEAQKFLPPKVNAIDTRQRATFSLAHSPPRFQTGRKLRRQLNLLPLLPPSARL